MNAAKYRFMSAETPQFYFYLEFKSMPKTKQQKLEILKELEKNLQKQVSLVFINYKGLSARDLVDFRQELRGNEAQMMVVKKTLLQKALREKGIETDIKRMEGQLGVVFAYGDPIAAIKNTHTFARAHESLQILGGYFENEIQNAAVMLEIASLPDKEELLAHLVGAMASPITGLVSVLQGNIKGLVYVLAQRAKMNV